MPPSRYSNNYSAANPMCPSGVENCTDSRGSLHVLPPPSVSSAATPRYGGRKMNPPPKFAPPLPPLPPPTRSMLCQCGDPDCMEKLEDLSFEVKVPLSPPCPPVQKADEEGIPPPPAPPAPKTLGELVSRITAMTLDFMGEQGDEEDKITLTVESKNGMELTIKCPSNVTPTGQSKSARSSRFEAFPSRFEDDWVSLTNTGTGRIGFEGNSNLSHHLR